MVISGGAEQVRSLVPGALNVDLLVAQVHRKHPGAVTVDINDLLERVAKPLHNLLRANGYNPELAKGDRSRYTTSDFSARDMFGSEIDAQLRDFAEQCEDLGKAQLALNQAEHRSNVHVAKARWGET